jgi:hypothetical protein
MQGMANHMSMCGNKAQHTSLPPSKLMPVQAKTLKIALQLRYRVASKLKAIVSYVLSRIFLNTLTILPYTLLTNKATDV